MLQEELTSDEPHENINATTTTLNRQKQEKEQMVNSAEIYQEKGTRVLDDIDLVRYIYFCLFFHEPTFNNKAQRFLHQSCIYINFMFHYIFYY